jgi:DNA primase
VTKQTILNHFNGDFIPFFSLYLEGLKRAGNEYKARCPFHEEKTPSLSINPDKGLFHCFECSADGDIFNFYSKLKNIVLLRVSCRKPGRFSG